MSAQASADDERARLEAAEWFARLNSKTVSTDALRDFRAWRGTPGNAAAYAHLEAIWKAAEPLATDTDIARAIEEALTPARTGRSLRDWLQLVVRSPLKFAVLALLGLGLLSVSAAVLAGLGGRTYSSGLGEQRIVRLEDGSQLRLDTDTQVRVRFSKDARNIHLGRGQAFFDVAHDAARPFTVAADDTEVRALGTRFDVRRDAGGVQVTLVEGKVRVRQTEGDHQWTMAPGEQLRVTEAKPSAPDQVRRIDVAAATSWTSGRLTFHQTPLASAVAEVNRYGRTKVSLDAPGLADRQVSGAFDSGDTEAFVAAVADLYDLEADRRDGQIVLRPVGSAAS